MTGWPSLDPDSTFFTTAVRIVLLLQSKSHHACNMKIINNRNNYYFVTIIPIDGVEAYICRHKQTVREYSFQSFYRNMYLIQYVTTQQIPLHSEDLNLKKSIFSSRKLSTVICRKILILRHQFKSLEQYLIIMV